MKKDLLFLTADKDAEELIKALLPRIITVEQLRTFTYEVRQGSGHDPGVYINGDDICRKLKSLYEYVFVLFDYEFSLTDTQDITAPDLEKDLKERLMKDWGDRCEVAVVQPEIENWIWVKDIQIKTAIGWKSDQEIRAWLTEKQFAINSNNNKPVRPKEALQAALRRSQRPHSPALFKKIAENASYQRCSDPAFLKMLATFRAWFPQSE